MAETKQLFSAPSANSRFGYMQLLLASESTHPVTRRYQAVDVESISSGRVGLVARCRSQILNVDYLVGWDHLMVIHDNKQRRALYGGENND
jgi:hypothetical protein